MSAPDVLALLEDADGAATSGPVECGCEFGEGCGGSRALECEGCGGDMCTCSCGGELPSWGCEDTQLPYSGD